MKGKESSLFPIDMKGLAHKGTLIFLLQHYHLSSKDSGFDGNSFVIFCTLKRNMLDGCEMARGKPLINFGSVALFRINQAFRNPADVKDFFNLLPATSSSIGCSVGWSVVQSTKILHSLAATVLVLGD